ncbi:hypothetical protein ACFQNF_06185 [Iodobacter arcticus]|uniref:Uncharacterized protein n=1 Tax=Iodobacter arcticus TaxID=590593 RepID=A0ABW2QVF0_9NEIS
MFSERFELVVSLAVVAMWLVITWHLFSPLVMPVTDSVLAGVQVIKNL